MNRPEKNFFEDIEILGSMTLNEVEQKTGVPIDYIIRELQLSPDTDRDERLGRLKKILGFTMEDVRHIVRKYEQDK